MCLGRYTVKESGSFILLTGGFFPALAYGCVYIGSEVQLCLLFNATDGKKIWQTATSMGLVFSNCL
jgi:hypothetical protein